jgi:AAA ATPase domain
MSGDATYERREHSAGRCKNLPGAGSKRDTMKIRKITIRNFRGIAELDWDLPDQHIFCLIGKGDSGKTSILEACYPQDMALTEHRIL